MTDHKNSEQSTISIQRADASHIDDIHQLLVRAAEWLEASGIRQWPYYSHDWVAEHVANREFYVAIHGDDVAGAFRLVWSDPDVWGEDDEAAGYVHSLVVDRRHSGQGLGRRILDWAEQHIAAHGKILLRLDCIVENDRLRGYYEAAGFQPAGQTRAWGRLMQRFQKTVGT